MAILDSLSDRTGDTVQTWDALGITTDLTFNLADQPLFCPPPG